MYKLPVIDGINNGRERRNTLLRIAEGRLQLKTSQLESDFIVDGELVFDDHSVNSLPIEQGDLGRVFRHFAGAAEESPVKEEPVLAR